MTRMIPRRKFLTGAGAALATGALLPLMQACGDDDAKQPAGTQAVSPSGTTAPSRADRLRLSGGQWGYPSPFAYNRGPGLAHALFMFDTLTWKDSTGGTIPWLATKSEGSPDGLRYTFPLNPKAAWHDGRPLTAEDIAFTFDYFANGPGKNAAGIVGRIDFIDKVTATSPQTVTLQLKQPYAPFDELVAGRVPILPRHIWNEVSDPAKFRDPKALTGSGPYRADSIDETAGAYRYKSNSSFFLGDPAVKALEFVPAPDELLALERGTLDAGSPPSEDGIPDGALKPFAGSDWGQLTAPGEFGRHMHINLAKPFPFNAKEFRQALAYGIDRKDMVKRLLLGNGEPGSLGGLAPSHPMIASGLPAYDVDVAKAKALLDGLRMKDVDGDGFRELPDGSKFNPELQTSTRYSPKTAELVKEYLRAIGINLTVTSLNSNSADDNAAKGNYELALVGYGGFGGDPDQLRTRFASSVKSQSFSRAIGYNNPKFDELADKQVLAVSTNDRKALVQEMQRLLADDVPQITLYLSSRIHIYRKAVFDAWYYTPGGVFGGYPGVLNKHSFALGKKVGI